jgi:hypothetical protein
MLFPTVCDTVRSMRYKLVYFQKENVPRVQRGGKNGPRLETHQYHAPIDSACPWLYDGFIILIRSRALKLPFSLAQTLMFWKVPMALQHGAARWRCRLTMCSAKLGHAVVECWGNLLVLWRIFCQLKVVFVDATQSQLFMNYFRRKCQDFIGFHRGFLGILGLRSGGVKLNGLAVTPRECERSAPRVSNCRSIFVYKLDRIHFICYIFMLICFLSQSSCHIFAFLFVKSLRKWPLNCIQSWAISYHRLGGRIHFDGGFGFQEKCLPELFYGFTTNISLEYNVFDLNLYFPTGYRIISASKVRKLSVSESWSKSRHPWMRPWRRVSQQRARKSMHRL